MSNRAIEESPQTDVQTPTSFLLPTSFRIPVMHPGKHLSRFSTAPARERQGGLWESRISVDRSRAQPVPIQAVTRRWRSVNARRRDVGRRLRLGHRLDPPESQEGGSAYADGLRTTTR